MLRKLSLRSVIALFACVLAIQGAALAPFSSAYAVVAIIHVDPANGSDLNSGAGGSPYRTIQKALQVATPGTTIRLASGTYQEANQTVTAGTAGAPIIIEPEPGAKPVLDGKANTLNAMRIVHSYYVVRGLEIVNFNEGVRLEGVTGVVLESNVVHHLNNEGIRLRYFSVRNILRNNKIYDTGLTSNGEGIYIGTAPEQRARNGGLPDTSTHNLLSGNELYGTRGEAIDVKEDSSFTTIENNIVHNVNAPNSGGMCIRSDENYLYGNVSYGNDGAGFRFGGDTVYSPLYGNNYHYSVKNVLRNNVANNNAGYGYKFMNGPQDADTSNTGSGNGGILYYYGTGVTPFVTPAPAPSPAPTPVPAPSIAPTLLAPSGIVPTLTPRAAWSAVAGADRYRVQVSTNNLFSLLVADSAAITDTFFDVSAGSLAWNTVYYWRVNASNAGGVSPWSITGNFRTAAGPPLAAPSLLIATAVSRNRIDLSWSDNSTGESGFRIERKRGVGGSWASIGTVPANTTVYRSSRLRSATTYYYRVRAYNGGGYSPYSNEAQATTPAR